MNVVLEISNLYKSYSSLKAVDGVSFKIHKGECYGLLGPNGAGKSTTIEMIEQVTKPNSGKILFHGKEVDRSFLAHLGVQFQQTALPPFLTVREALKVFSMLYPSPLAVDELIKMCQLENFANRRHERISGGQRQRLLLAVALCSNPDIVLLDEPTTGLDPQARRHLWQIVKNIKSQGKTIILTTHYMDEAQELCDRIGIMDKGRIILEGNPSDLLSKHFNTVVVEIPKDVAKLFDFSAFDIFIKRDREKSVELHTSNLNDLLQKLSASGSDLKGVRIRQSNLEDLFLKLTGEELRF